MVGYSVAKRDGVAAAQSRLVSRSAAQYQLEVEVRQAVSISARYWSVRVGVVVVRSAQSRWSRFLVPFDSATEPVDGFLDTCASQGTQRKDSTVSDAASFFTFDDFAHQAFLDADDFDTVLAILLVCQNEKRDALGLSVL